MGYLGSSGCIWSSLELSGAMAVRFIGNIGDIGGGVVMMFSLQLLD